MEEFDLIREVIKDYQNAGSRSESFTTGFYQRLFHALQNRQKTGPRDLAALIRGILRYEAEKVNGHSQLLHVPKGLGFSEAEQWEQAGLDVIVDSEDAFLIRAHRWSPNWLEGSAEYPLDQPLFALEERNQLVPVPGDPFLRVLGGLEKYRCKGQRDAIRSIMTAPEGSTLVINLPTGAGKSLCAYLPALRDPRSTDLTVVIVPTTALAVDQERAMKKYVDHPTAYYGGSERDSQKQAIRERMMDGSQRIVFTSPESLMQSLQYPLQVAVERGFLRYFVVDEAHIVDAWGDEFRSSFQEMAGWRRFILRTAPMKFTTLLLSATITEHCLDTLETLFADPGPFEVFSAAYLRPEPSYWSKKCSTEEERRERVLEAISHLPRPLILYTSTVDDANEWRQTLVDQGYKRCSVVTGKTNDKQRSQVIQGWHDQTIDIVIATSAFGMGVDQSGVRAVLHACIPESVDRYYQEVGRGGRDGRASLSLVLYTEKDKEIAKGLNQKKLISIERGLQRWEQMFRSKVTLDPDRSLYKVSINVSPSVEGEEIDMNTERNRAWNVRTLTLMGRSGMVELEWEGRAASAEAVVHDFHTRVIRITDHNHLDEENWDRRVQAFRKLSLESDRRNLNLMFEVLEGARCTGEIFHELYQISDRQGEHPRQAITVHKVCGGCAVCRKSASSMYFTDVKSKPVEWEEKQPLSDRLKGMSRDRNEIVVFYDGAAFEKLSDLTAIKQHEWVQAVRWFIDQGVQHFVGDDDFLNFLQHKIPHIEREIVFLSKLESTVRSRYWPRVPTLVFQPPAEQLDKQVQRLLRGSDEGEARIFFLPKTAQDPLKQGRLLKERLDGYVISEFRKVVGV